MPRVRFADLPDHGRLWVFPSSRPLSDDDLARSLETVDEFLDGWAAHGTPLRSARELREDRFLLVGVDVDAESPSGCSIDALVNRLRALGDELGSTWIEHSPVWFREGAGVRVASRSEFKAMAGRGEVTPDTAVFDTSLTTVAQARAGELERPARETWHGRAFFRSASGV